MSGNRKNKWEAAIHVLGERMVALTRVLAVENAEKLKYSKLNLESIGCADKLDWMD